jgi:hypothetical protein
MASAGAEAFAVDLQRTLSPYPQPLQPQPGPDRGETMITLCIRYTLDVSKLADFEAYARALQPQIARCGGKVAGYFLPTKLAGATNSALGLIDFPSLAAYEQYRERLAADPDAAANLQRAEAARCILNEERSFIRAIAG